MSIRSLPATTEKRNGYEMSKIELKFIEEGSGRTLNFSAGEVTPLGFSALTDVIDKLDGPISFPLRMTGVRVEHNEFADIDDQTIESVSASLASTHGSTTIGLVKGGWLPSGLACRDSLVLPDRCTVAAIRGRFLGGVRKNGPHDDFLDFLADHPIRINPMLCAMEGINGRVAPDATELSDLFDRATKSILEALPNAVIFPGKPAVMRGALGIISDSAEAFHRKQKFLMKAAPLQAPSIGRAARPGVFRQLFDLAREFGLTTTSMLMMTVLSAASANQNFNPAKKLLKPKRPYSKGDAYNALSDLRALDLLIGACTDFPDQSVTLLTEDKALSLMWTGSQPHSFIRDGVAIRYSMRFPRYFAFHRVGFMQPAFPDVAHAPSVRDAGLVTDSQALNAGACDYKILRCIRSWRPSFRHA
jgi:hypothetical protein